MALKKNEFDLAVDILLGRQKDTTGELVRRFKNTRPFRQEPVPHKEALLDFDEMMSREQELRRDFGDEVVDAYIKGQGGKYG